MDFIQELRTGIAYYADPISYDVDHANPAGFVWWDCGRTAQDLTKKIDMLLKRNGRGKKEE